MENGVFIKYEIYQELKNPKYKLNQGWKFKIEDLDEGVMYFDENQVYIDPKRLEIEDITIGWVLLPRFFWEENMLKLEEFIAMDNQGNKYEFVDFIRNIQEIEKRYEVDLGEAGGNELDISMIKNISNKNYKNYIVNNDPRENQVPIIKHLLKIINDQKKIRGILQAAPGVGKTFMGIFLGQIFKKTLVIVPKVILEDQWKQAFLTFTDLKEEDICILQGSEIKDIEEAMKAKVIITKPQSLLSQIKRIKINLLQELYSEVDFVLADECHGFGAYGYSKTLSLFKTCNVMGLSATPFRKDLNKFLLNTSIGDVLIEADAEVLTPEIYIQRLNNDFIHFNEKEAFALKQRMNDYPMMLSLYNMYLYNKDSYLQFLTQWVKWFRDTNREVVILFSTNKLAKKLADILLGLYPEFQDETLVLKGDSKQDSIQIAKDENKILKNKLKEFKEELNLKVKNKELKRKEADLLYKEERVKSLELQEINIQKALDLYYQRIKESKILISNFNLLREGFDKSSLSGIIFGSPIIGRITIVQSLGRITRLHEGKPTPIALFPVTEMFETLNKSVTTIIRNNVLGTYPNAKINFM